MPYPTNALTPGSKADGSVPAIPSKAPDWWAESNLKMQEIRDELKHEIEDLRMELRALQHTLEDSSVEVISAPSHLHHAKTPAAHDATDSAALLATGATQHVDFCAADTSTGVGHVNSTPTRKSITKDKSASSVHITQTKTRSRRKDPIMQDEERMRVMLSQDSRAAELLTEALDDTLIDQYPLQPSVYDAMLLVWTPIQSKSSSIFLVSMLLLNIFVQLYYCSIVYFAFVVPRGDFTEDNIAGYRNWRENVAHDVENMDKLSQVSLASRVCTERAHASLEFSTAQAYAVQDIIEYVTDFRGSGMTMVSVFCWLIFVSDELRNVLAFAQAIYVMPPGTTAMTVSVIAFRMDVISLRRKVMMYMTLMVRVVVAGLLAGIGSYFLIYTRTVGDLILNAVALEMVQHMDKLIFRTLAPTRVKKCMSMLQPLLLEKNTGENDRGTKPLLGIGRGALLTLAFAMLALGAFTPTIMQEHTNREAALQEICPYNVENDFEQRTLQADTFVYGVDSTGMFIWTNTPSFEEAEAAQVHRVAAVHDIIDLGRFNVTCEIENVTDKRCLATARKLPLIDHSISSLVYNMKVPVELKLMQFHGDNLNFVSEGSSFQGCHDVARADGKTVSITNKSVIRSWMLGALSNAVGTTVTDCAEVEHLCLVDSLQGLRTRMWCPETCGCNRPDSPNQLTVEYGCPAQCAKHPTYKEVADAATCEDVRPGDAKWPSFQRLAQSLLLQGESHGPLYKKNLNQVAGGLMMLGCPFVVAMDFCDSDAEDGAKKALKNLRYWCPVSCGCSNMVGALDCPTACNGTEASETRMYAKRLVYMPGLPGSRGALPTTML
eukprot:TRINITY_DN3420_c0_g1_i1.p1 TRINITY_DN3420_c0_g1~~TRINITY_DN3420_c0_g1_i1.p1  ORF type:complete len:832 (+),score=125.81 TRINITY_DN3420_c0_g1_i1:125-2620(+)